MLAEALESEVQDYLDAARGERDQYGHALVVCNGHANEREVPCRAGAVEVKVPRLSSDGVGEGRSRVHKRRVGRKNRGEGRPITHGPRFTRFDDTSSERMFKTHVSITQENR
jgi:hypothetical protein